MSDITDRRELFKVLLFTVMQLGLEYDRRVQGGRMGKE